MMIDIAEPLFQAMDQIIAERLKSVKYDTTIVATIIDASKAKEHKYQCKSEAATFEAYSDNIDYKENSTVLVTVPNNDFSQQKTIIGKYIAKDNNGPYNLVLPLDSFVDATSNLIYNSSASPTIDYSQKIGLLANNDIEDKKNPDIKVDKDTGAIEFDDKVFTKIWSSNKTHIGYTRLGIRGQFQSHLFGLNVVEGQYGYYLILKVQGDNVAGEEPSTEYVDLIFNTSDMFGDPYNFEAFYQQEKVFDISKYKNIVGMDLFFYQGKDFKNQTGNSIGTKDDFGNELGLNLFTKDPYIALGFDAADFSGETALIYSPEGTTYNTTDNFIKANGSNANNKNIYLRWLYKNDNGNIIIIDTKEELPANVSVSWKYYPIGEKTIGWRDIIIENQMLRHPFSIIYKPQINTSEERVKAVITITEEDNSTKTIETNILRFTNENETVSNLTQNLMAGLSLYCEDESYGNYYVYDQANKIYQDFHKERRRIKAVFHDYDIKTGQYNELQVSDIAQEIVWEFPNTNTMITVEGWDKDNKHYSYNGSAEDYINTVTTGLVDNKINIGRKAKNSKIKSYQEYHINNTYNASAFDNTIECRILYNGLWYSASKDFSFGLMGTNGSDVSVEIDFDNNKVALTAGEVNEYKVTAHIYNSAHQEISNTSSYKFEWSWEYKHPEASTTISLDNTDKKSCIIKTTTGLKIDTFLILKVKILGILSYLDEENQDPLEFPLIAYKAIPIRNKKEYRYIIAPTQIIYSSSGYPDFYKDSMKVYRVPDGEVNSNDFATVDIIEETGGVWSIWDPYEIGSEYRGVIGKNNVLKPLEYFIKNVKPYGIQYTNGGQVVWSQPLVIMQNEYPSAVVNKWNGKSIELNNEKGYFLSPAIAAGKKNDDNSFSGVMIGDLNHLEATNDLTKMTGLYGFHEGATSFAFMEDGTGYIGKSGDGRILIDGKTGKGVIKSNNWESMKTNTNPGFHSGMYIDITSGAITMQGKDVGSGSTIYNNIALNASAGKNEYPLSIGRGDINTRNFKVKWDGSIYARNGHFTGEINATSGTLGTLEVTGTLSGGYIEGATINGSVIHGAQIFFGDGGGYYYYFVAEDGQQKTNGPFEKSNVYEIGKTYDGLGECTNVKWVSGTDTGYVGIGKGSSGSADTKVLLLESLKEFPLKLRTTTHMVLQSKESYILIQTSDDTKNSIKINEQGDIEISGSSLTVRNIEAKNQKGIYARFA